MPAGNADHRSLGAGQPQNAQDQQKIAP